MQNNMEELATKHFMDGYLCSESVLLAAAEALGIDSPLVPAVATAFGSGLARTDGMCGALTGGILALSLVNGRKNSDEKYDKLYADIAALKADFHATFGSCECTKLLGFSLSEGDAKEKFSKQNCRADKCAKFVGFVADKIRKTALKTAQ